jgi:hypothetical protein
VTAGQPYIVGERRPELFVPNQSGTIIPKVPALAGAGGGGSQVTVTFERTGDPLLDAIIEGLRYRVSSRHGGSVQRALGRGRG